MLANISWVFCVAAFVQAFSIGSISLGQDGRQEASDGLSSVVVLDVPWLDKERPNPKSTPTQQHNAHTEKTIHPTILSKVTSTKDYDHLKHTADQRTEPTIRRWQEDQVQEVDYTGRKDGITERQHDDGDSRAAETAGIFHPDISRVSTPLVTLKPGTMPYIQGRAAHTTSESNSTSGPTVGHKNPDNEPNRTFGQVNFIIIGCVAALIIFVALVSFALVTYRKKKRQARAEDGLGAYTQCATSAECPSMKSGVDSPETGERMCRLAYSATAEGNFDNNGGKLSTEDSDIIVKIDHGTIPDNVRQTLFYRVIYDARPLLQALPEGPNRTLISPVFESGPSNAILQKPVEIIVPHSLYLDGPNKANITVFRSESSFSVKGPVWEKVSSESEKTNHSKSWFTVKKDTIIIRTKTFSNWCIFACGAGPKKKRAAVFASKPNPSGDEICLRFYVYGDNRDSEKRLEMQEKKRFPKSKYCTREKPFKMFHDDQDLTVSMINLEEGWALDRTPETQNHSYEFSYHDGFRVKDCCEFVVMPIKRDAKPFSCCMTFQQGDHTKHFFYVNPGMPAPGQSNIQERRAGSQSHEKNPPVNSGELQAGGVPSEVELNNLAKEIPECWYSLGIQLCLDRAALDNIHLNNVEHTSPAKKAFQMLVTWRNSGKCATYGELSEALSKVDRHDLAERISTQQMQYHQQNHVNLEPCDEVANNST